MGKLGWAWSTDGEKWRGSYPTLEEAKEAAQERCNRVSYYAGERAEEHFGVIEETVKEYCTHDGSENGRYS